MGLDGRILDKQVDDILDCILARSESDIMLRSQVNGLVEERPSKEQQIRKWGKKGGVQVRVKFLLHGKQIVFKHGEINSVKELKKVLRAQINKNKCICKDKIEKNLSGNNLRTAWQCNGLTSHAIHLHPFVITRLLITHT